MKMCWDTARHPKNAARTKEHPSYSIFITCKLVMRCNNSIIFFPQKNNANDGYYTINSGVEDVNKLGEIIEWKNSSVLSTWQPANSTCNKITGTDTTIFSPHKSRTSKFGVFQSDICR